MPYFIDDGNCVRKGTKEEPGEQVKCHESHAAAVAHLRALYVNVEDAEKLYVEVEDEMFAFEKGGPKSGWYGPERGGTHTAENAPNFAGGPGADREYGTESDEPPDKTRRCKCPKCGAVIVLPKGKQCEDIKCPSCGGAPRQTEWREDKPAEGRGGRRPDPGRTKAQATHTCTCPECDKSVQVPQGQKCNEVKCPACEAMMRQGEEEKAMDSPSYAGAVHGEGSMMGQASAVMGSEDSECKCPHCGKGLPCTAKACPYCKKSIDKVERGEGDEAEGEKAEWSAASVNDLPDSSFLYVESGGEKDGEGKTTPRSLRHLPYKNASGEVDLPHLRNAISRLGQPATGKGWMSEDLRKRLLSKARGILAKHGGSPEEKSFVSYKSADGQWRWLSLSNWAVVDKEREVVSEQAYRDAIAYAQKSGDWGQLDLVHVDGTDVGEADTLFILSGGKEPPKLGAGGTWYDTAKAIRAREAIQADPAHWGMSLKFRFDPAQRVHGVYVGGIQILKHSILPQQMAASYGTAIAVQGGEMSKQLDEKQAEALLQLGHTEDEIAELAEKQKALPEEENVVEKKEDSTPEDSAKVKLYKSLGRILGIVPEGTPEASSPAEARKAEEVTEPAQDEVIPAEKAEGAPETAETEPGEIVKSLAPVIAASIGEALKVELEKRDARIEELETIVKSLGDSVEEKVAARLADLPPVVKVAASEVSATVVPPEKAAGIRVGHKAQDNSDFAQQLLAGIKQVVEDETAKRQYQA